MVITIQLTDDSGYIIYCFQSNPGGYGSESWIGMDFEFEIVRGFTVFGTLNNWMDNTKHQAVYRAT